MRFACERKKRVLCAAMRVDLNPARAAMCDILDKSDHTTIQRRLREREQLTKRRLAGKNLLDPPLNPVAGLEADGLLDITESSYIALVQWTGEQARSDKRSKLKPLTEQGTTAPADIWQVASHPKVWLRQVHGTESLYYRAVGSAEALMVTRLVREHPVARRVRVVQAGRSLTEITTGVAKATSRIIDRRERAECAAIASRSREDFLMRRVEPWSWASCSFRPGKPWRKRQHYSGINPVSDRTGEKLRQVDAISSNQQRAIRLEGFPECGHP